ncbi:MAG: radical SAM protein [Planctomycetes bacterium]|nr:radical SAM protein [Planctomycetota bacterium]
MHTDPRQPETAPAASPVPASSSIPHEGFVDDCDCTRIAGWCWRADRPDEPVELVILDGERELGRTFADKFRRDLLLAGKGNGKHGFHFDLPEEYLHRASGSLSVRTAQGSFELVGSPAHVKPLIQELILSPPVFERYVDGPPLEFGTLRVDIANTCNLFCVYCPTIALRTKERVDLPRFERFLAQRVAKAQNFAIGCGQEPTTNPELVTFLEAIARSPAKPTEHFMLVTNGTLLHKHDWPRIAASGLNALYVSLDSVDPDVLGGVRTGSKLALIQENVTGLLAAAPNLKLHLNVVVTNRNLGYVEDVIAWGTAQHAASFTLREMYFPPTPNPKPTIEETELRGLMLQEGEFAALRERLIRRFGPERFVFADRLHLEQEYAYWAPKLV